MAGRRRLMFAKHFVVDYLRFTALESGTFTLTIGANVTTANLSYVEYSTDEGETWTKTDNVASTTVTITTPTLSTGDSVLFRGSGIRTAQANTTIDNGYRSTFSSTCQCNVSGNLNTLLQLNKPTDSSLSTYSYKGLFYQMTRIIDASELTLPSVGTNAYRYMFYHCTGLTAAPKLPSSDKWAYDYCFYGMFEGCTSLIKAPDLLYSTIRGYCYEYMFNGCTGLTQAPQLPATTLNTGCYAYMFQGCTSLVTAPYLPATSLGSSNYLYMFKNCSLLNYIKADFGGKPTYCTTDWVSGVAASGTFIKSPNLEAFYPESPNLSSPINVPYAWTIYSSFTVKSIDGNGVFTTTPSTWVNLVGLSGKTLNLTIGEVTFSGSVDSSYNYTGTSGNKTITMATSVTYDTSRVPIAVSVQYTITGMSFSANDVIDYSYYGE